MGIAAMQVTKDRIEVIDNVRHNCLFVVFGEPSPCLGWEVTSQHSLEAPFSMCVAGVPFAGAPQFVGPIPLGIVPAFLAKD